MGLTETAPLLASYWPVLAALVLGFLANYLIQALQGSSPRKGKPRVRGQPTDEDNHVFQDTIGREKDAIPVGKQEEDDFAFPEEEGGGVHIPYRPTQYPPQEMVRRSLEFYKEMNERRSVRFFSDRPVPREVLENAIRTAGENSQLSFVNNGLLLLLLLLMDRA